MSALWQGYHIFLQFGMVVTHLNVVSLVTFDYHGNHFWCETLVAMFTSVYQSIYAIKMAWHILNTVGILFYDVSMEWHAYVLSF